MSVKLAKSQTRVMFPPTDYINSGGLIQNMPRSYTINGLVSDKSEFKYHDIIKQCRWFYVYDSIAGTVVNRMADMAITTLRNRKKSRINAEPVDEVTMAYFDALVLRLKPILKLMALEYLLHGMAVPDYRLERVRGNTISEILGRKRYTIPADIWVRNPDNLRIKRRPAGIDRQVYLVIPPDDLQFVLNKGMRADGTNDPEGYAELVRNFPEFVNAILRGETTVLLDNARPIFRKVNSYLDYPIPFLTNALSALQHKAYLKSMDKSLASKAITAIRHVKVGDKDFPADDDDITDMRTKLLDSAGSGERVFDLYTNHTISIEWIFPPLDALVNEAKYAEPNADIFLALGFPRVLTVGETLRSNSSDSKIASTGPKATLEDLRDAIIIWIKDLYQILAQENDFVRVPEPYFSPITTSDYTALVQFADKALTAGAISKNDVSQLWGTDYDTVADQLETEYERDVPSPAEKAALDTQQFQMDMQKQQNEQMANNQADNTSDNSGDNNEDV